MTNPFRQFNYEAHYWEKRGRNASVAIQLCFFGERFLTAARRSRTISRSSLPSQKSITSLARAIRCSTWKLNGRPRRRHISSSSARCSSDMRMLYRRFFFATCKGCQSKEMNSLQKRVDNGRQWLTLNASLFPKRHRETSGRNGDSAARFYYEMNLANPAALRGQKEAHFQKGNL